MRVPPGQQQLVESNQLARQVPNGSRIDAGSVGIENQGASPRSGSVLAGSRAFIYRGVGNGYR